MNLLNPTLEQVIKNLSADQLNLMLVGEKSQLSINDLIKNCNEKGIRIAGGIFPGVISETEHSDSNIIIKKYDLSTEVKMFRDLQHSKN